MVKIVERITYRDDETLENTDRKIEISGKIVGSQMTAGVLKIMGWHLVMLDPEHQTSIQIDGDQEIEEAAGKNCRKNIHSGETESACGIRRFSVRNQIYKIFDHFP